MRRTLIASVAVVSLAGCQRSVDVVSGGEVAPITPVVSANSGTLSAGSTMEVQLNQQLSTETNKAASPIISPNTLHSGSSVQSHSSRLFGSFQSSSRRKCRP